MELLMVMLLDSIGFGTMIIP